VVCPREDSHSPTGVADICWMVTMVSNSFLGCWDCSLLSLDPNFICTGNAP
jgi:hypothetical protein